MMAAMNTTERQKKTRMLERSHSRVPPEIEIALLQRCGVYVCTGVCVHEYIREGGICVKSEEFKDLQQWRE